MARTGGRLDTLGAAERRDLRHLLVVATRRADAAASDIQGEHEVRRLLARLPDWSLPEAASLHRLGGAVLRGLDRAEADHPAARSALGALRQHAQLRQLLTIGALSEIATAFDREALTWLTMKGPVLSACYYTDTGDRGYGDLDLLVDRRDFPQAVRLLEAMGYRHSIRNWDLAQAMLAGQIEMVTDVVSVDLHWQLHYSRDARRPFRLRPDHMLDRAVVRSVGPRTVPTFDDADTVVSLCFHAARSGGHRLVWLKDIERALAVGAPDDDDIVCRAESSRIGPPVGLMLDRARRILGAPVADGLPEALCSSALLGVERRLTGWRSPIQFDDGSTMTQAFARSVRASDAATLGDIPVRGMTALRRWAFPPPENETDDEEEKERFFAAVVNAPPDA